MQSINRAERRRSSRELAKCPQWGTLEEFTRSRIQSWLQDVLEEEVTELLGRGKSERRWMHRRDTASRAECERLRDQFAARYCRLCPKAGETLSRDWERMVTFYRFPKDHWIHLRTSNPVESPFSAVRLRTDAARRYTKVATAEALIWKILMIAEKKFRRLNSPQLLAAVYDGQPFADGVPV